MNANDIIQLVGVLYLVFGFSLLFNKHYYRDIIWDYMDSKWLMLLSGIVSFILWFVLLKYFNDISYSKEWVVAVLSWIALFKWVSVLLFPKKTIKMSIRLINKNNIEFSAYLVIILWLIFTYFGYFS